MHMHQRLPILFILIFTCILGFLSCSDSSRSSNIVKRLHQKVLVIAADTAFENSSNRSFFRVVRKICNAKSIDLDSLPTTQSLTEELLKNYSALLLLGEAPTYFTPYCQTTIERYAQMGSGIIFINTAPPPPYTWPFYRLVADSSNTLPNHFYQTQNNLRLVYFQSDSTFLASNEFQNSLADQLEYAIGDNSYDYSLATTPQAPHPNRFTTSVLDQEINEPMEMAILSDGSVLFIERRGKMKVFDNQRKETRLLANFNTCIEGNYEDGLLGLAVDPDYRHSNHYLYLYYSPPCDIPYQYLSRFIYKNDSLHRTSETIMLKVGVQRETCCHSGGSIEFGPDGLLYLSTGDNTSSKESDGYTPIDERPGRSPFDAQKSSANTHDLRGKILRIRPEADGSYSIPDGNLFPKDGSAGRPEIYIMGARNPFRISIDAKTNYLYWGDVGPDSGADGKYGPQSYDEFNQARQAGNYGWPYFIADNKAYPDRNFATDQVGNLFDPAIPVNHSPFNTGDTLLPAAQPAMIWYPYGNSDQFPFLGSGGRSALAGPVYYSDLAYPASTTKFPAYYDGKLFIYDWVRNWILLASFDQGGQLIQLEPFQTNTSAYGPIDMQFGPDGSMYLLEYGNAYFLNNPQAKLSRITFSKGNRPPIAQLQIDPAKGKAPLKVTCDATASYDYDLGDSLYYEWHFPSGELIQGTEAVHTILKPGKYSIQLTVTDRSGAKAETRQEIWVGNAPPDISIAIDGNQSFYFPQLSPTYQISIHDEEDRQQGGIDPLRASVSFTHISDSDYLNKIRLDPDALPAGQLQHLQGRLRIEQSDCRSCHQDSTASIGPSYWAVATKYKDRQGAAEYLSSKIINGGNGVWGKSMMSAHPGLSKQEATEMANYILSMQTAVSLPFSGQLPRITPSSPVQGGYVLAASYQDKGANGIPSIQHRHIHLLRAPMLQAEHADAQQNMWKARFGKGMAQTQYMAYGGDAWIVFEQLDLQGIRQIGLMLQPTGGGRISIHLDQPDGTIIGSKLITEGSAETPWKEQVLSIKSEYDVHDVYIRVQHTDPINMLNLDWVRFYPGY